MRLRNRQLDLNAEQRRAVRFGTSCRSSPLLVLAGAGSGKTGVLAHRVAHLIEQGVDRNRILLLTFTRLAATEMTERVAGLIEAPSPSSKFDRGGAVPWAGTFHSIGLRLLRALADEIDLDPTFTVLDAYAARSLMGDVRDELGFAAGAPDTAECQAIYSFKVNARSPLADVLDARCPKHVDQLAKLKKLFAAYTKAKRAQNVVDFDDLLRLWLKLLRRPKTARSIRRLWDHVLVDELQDTNRLQLEIVRRLKPDGVGLTVVGDDAQAIYGFRAADVTNILRFSEHFTEPATTVTLETNYRSTAAILDASNAVIALAPTGLNKTLRTPKDGPTGSKPALVTVADDQAQARYVVKQVLANQRAGMPLAEQAVLFRIGSHSVDIEAECRRRNVAFVKFGGNALLEKPHVRDLLALLSWAENPKDQTAARRLLCKLPDVGPATAKKFIDSVDGTKVLTALRAFKPPAAASQGWKDVLDVMRGLRKRDTPWLQQLAHATRWIEARAALDAEHGDLIRRDVKVIMGAAKTFTDRPEFLANFALDPGDADAAGKGDDRLVLSTIHAVKGKEFEAVFVINVVDGALPFAMAVRNSVLVAEERRLLYVAMTRAKHRLTLTMPRASALVRPTVAPLGRLPPANRSRFIPAALLALFDEQEA